MSLHLAENLGSKVGFAGLNIRANRSVENDFGGFREVAVGMEEGLVEMVLAVGGDEGDEEGLGVGEFVAAEEGRKEGEERGGGLGEGGGVGLSPFEEGDESGRLRSEGGGGEDGEEEGLCHVGNVGGQGML